MLRPDVRSGLRRIYYWTSGDPAPADLKVTKPPVACWRDGLPDLEPFAGWLSETDLDYKTKQFQRGGVCGHHDR